MRANVITIKQAQELEDLHHNKCVSANDFNRHVLESLVELGYAFKHYNGRAVTYTLTAAGEAVWRSL